MRRFLIIFGWVSIVGSVGDGLIAAYALWVIGSGGWEAVGMSVEFLLQHHIGFLYWVKQVTLFVMPHSVVDWLMALPALGYFPTRVLISIVIGWWALAVAKKMPVKA